jgi:hypothetical protein
MTCNANEAVRNFTGGACLERERGARDQWEAVQSCPLRVKSRTPAASRRTSMRKPSCLISCSQPAPAGGLAAGLGRQGSQKSGKATRRNNMSYK